MIAAAIVCAAAMSQAASLAWTSAGYLWDTTANAKATSITGGSIVLALINDGADWTKGVTVLDTGALVASGMAANIGKVQGSMSGKFEWSFADGTLKNGDVLTVLFKDAKGEFSQLHYVDADGKLTDTLVTDTYTMSGLSADDSTLDAFKFASSTAAGSSNFAPQAVPEPTLAMLLLLGVAGLALKRRRA